MRLMSGSRRGRGERLFPELGEKMEALITTMANVLVVETFAENTFNWAQALLGDPDVSAHAADAAHMVTCIAADEVPHVDYLTTAMSELRARTLISEDGLNEFQGSEVVDLRVEQDALVVDQDKDVHLVGLIPDSRDLQRLLRLRHDGGAE